MKIVFSLTDHGNGYYCAMTRLAIAAIRATNPSAEIVIVSDWITETQLKGKSDPIVSEVDGWTSVETPPGTILFTNRFVRTACRSVVDGDFLHLDADVLVRGDLSEIFDHEADIAVAVNNSGRDFREQVWDEDMTLIETLGWRCRGDAYFNSGLIFLRDNREVRSFCEQWHEKFLESNAKVGRAHDQAPFNACLGVFPIKLKVLDDKFNAQFKVNPRVASGAVMWHFFAFDSDRREGPPTFFEDEVKKIAAGGPIDAATVSEMIQRPHPWRTDGFMHCFAAERMQKRNKVAGLSAAWLQRKSLSFLVNQALALIQRPINSFRYRCIRKR